MNVTGVFIYPIKSCRGIELKEAEVTPKGFAWDREFVIVDEKGKFITQRQYSQLAKVRVCIEKNDIALSLEDDSIQTFQFTPNLGGKQINVEIWRDRVVGIDQGDRVAQWLQLALNLKGDFRLVRYSPYRPRPVNPKYATRKDNSVSFADGYPFLLTNTASLDELNRRLEAAYDGNSQAVPMNRFRPNIVVDGDEPFAEDNWDAIQIGETIFDLVKPCDRCIIITTDQSNGKRNSLQEPLKTLSTFRRFSQAGILFGENMIPRNVGLVRVGDRVVSVTSNQ
ncbi:MAG: MOSC domain-containing protein [Cyanobacteriota bacterium]|nr:MOSC domain-containing protein [Cyanobacteriota bacterium]